MFLYFLWISLGDDVSAGEGGSIIDSSLCSHAGYHPWPEAVGDDDLYQHIIGHRYPTEHQYSTGEPCTAGCQYPIERQYFRGQEFPSEQQYTTGLEYPMQDQLNPPYQYLELHSPGGRYQTSSSSGGLPPLGIGYRIYPNYLAYETPKGLYDTGYNGYHEGWYERGSGRLPTGDRTNGLWVTYIRKGVERRGGDQDIEEHGRGRRPAKHSS